MKFIALASVAASLCAAALTLPTAAQAAVFPVTTTADVFDPTPDGECSNGPGGTCPLREAVQESNTASLGDDTIQLPPGTYTFKPGMVPLVEAAGKGKLTIVGGTARDTTINGADVARIFSVVTGGSLELRDLTLRDGKTDVAGGAIMNEGTVSLTDVALVSNEAFAGGGGIASTGTLTLDRVTLAGNESGQAGAALSVARLGGANPGIATITNTTVGGSYTRGRAGVMVAGGAVLTLLNSTVSGNIAKFDHVAGGLHVEDAGSTVVLANSIVAGNSPLDCEAEGGGAFVSHGGNVVGDAECGAGPAADPKLGPLQDNGGQTDTFALLAGSAALDAGTAPGCLAADQRGVGRPQGGACDAGAFEAEPAAATSSPPAPPAPPPAPTGDAIAPGISDAFATNRIFAVDRRGAVAAGRRVRRGTTFVFSVSEAARVELRIERSSAGRRVRGKCRRPTSRNRRARRCIRWVSVRTLARDATAGSNRVRFSGRVMVRGRARALRPGRYRLRMTAVDAAGNRSAPATIRFRVVRR